MNKKQKGSFSIFFILLINLFVPVFSVFAAPFVQGEKLVFEVRWTIVPAGTVVLSILPDTEMAGRNCRHFSMQARTTSFVDLFYKVRDRIDSYAEKGMKASLLYTKKKNGKSKRDVRVEFDLDEMQATYSNFGQKRPPIPIQPSTLDPLSVFYAFRTMELSEGKTLHAYVSDGKKVVLGTAEIIRKETIEVDEKEYETLLVEPELRHLGGVFEKSRDARLKIWVTADEKRIPVRIESEVIVGSFVAELVSID